MSSSASSSVLKSIKPQPKINIFVWIIAFLAFLGFLDSSYLTISHYTGADLNCGPIEGCNIVTRSPYALIFGIPVALLGTLYYLVVFFSSLLYLDQKNKIFLKILPFLSIAGLLASAWFVYVQLGILNAICVYCMVSATISTTIFILSWLMFFLNKR